MSAVHNVIGVRMEQASDGSHRHVTGVWVQENYDGPPYTPRQVAESIREGETWQARVEGVQARVQPAARCPHPGCELKPYLVIRDQAGRDLLERMHAL
jgi:hypothetical protein